jgi:pimeloyl-ACP methyl ester carboxylesterase
MNRKRWLLLIPLLLALLVAGSFGWALTGPGPEPAALAALESDTAVQVESGPWLVFTPVGAAPRVGLVFYPGARVDARAYAPAARAIAAEGYLVAIVPMPLRLAFFNANAAQAVQAAYPEIGAWAVGGHSLGGVAAAQFVSDHPDAVQGLALWAAYPPEGADLSGRALAVVSVYGTLDALASPAEVLAAVPQLPPSTLWVPIEGGNHAQFGRYGPQVGDNPATISPEAQQAQLVAATVELLRRIER